MKYRILCGGYETMKKVAEKGVKGLNSKTMKWQIVDKGAIYSIRKPDKGKTLSYLYSDKDLHNIAEQKGLII